MSIDINKNYFDLDLMDGWRWAKLNEIGIFLKGVSYDKDDSSKIFKSGYIPIIRATNIKDKLNLDEFVYVDKKYVNQEQFVKKDDIIIAMSSGSKDLVGKASQAYEDFEGAFGTFCGLIRPSNLINKRFLGYFFQSQLYRNYISKLSSGVNINNLRRYDIETLLIPIPPLNEQKRIVTKLEELFTKLDAGIEYLKKSQILLKQYRQSILKYAFEGKLTEKWREKYTGKTESALLLLEKLAVKKNGNKSDIKTLNQIPKEWIMTTIENIANVGTGLTPLRSNKKFYHSGSIPWIKSTSLNKSIVTTADEFLTEYAIEKTGIHSFPPHTLLIAMLGDGKTRGRVSELFIPATINQACAAIVIDEKFPTVRKYVKLFLQKQYDEIRKLSAGGVQSNLNLTLIKRIKIPLPPLSEQEIIVKYAEKQISFINKIEFSISEQLMKFKILKKSILKAAFEGKLVSQDTSDEPAEILLERIKRERESTIPIKKEKSKIVKRKSIDNDGKQMRLM